MNISRIIPNTIKRLLPKTAVDYVSDIVWSGDVEYALDLGCGNFSHLTRHRPQIRSVGIDAYEPALAEGRLRECHDTYVLADFLEDDISDIKKKLLEETGRDSFDLVTAFHLIEHLPKKKGWELLEVCERLSSKYILIETPNGFLPQGPEFGNPYQRHLSGWYPHDFRGWGYTVCGASGTRYLRGYMGMKRLPIPGLVVFDEILLSRAIMSRQFPAHAFNLVAIKDVRGVPPRFKVR